MRHFSWTRWVVRLIIAFGWLGFLALLFILARTSWFSEDRSITVLSWSVMFDHDRIREFEKKTGIRVYLNHYESNEELLVKLRATGGHGFDLVAPSDYAVEKLIKEGLLKPLNRSKMPYFSALNPKLLGHYFDSENRYSVPYIWSVYCIAYNAERVHPDLVGSYWDLLFARYNNEPWYKVVMTNDPLEALVFGSVNLFGLPLSVLDDQRQRAVAKLLKRQKQWVEQYGNLRGDFALQTGSADAVVMHSGEALRAARMYSKVDFVVPRPSVVTIEHCAIPIGSNKEDLVYDFLAFMFAPETFASHFPKTLDFPARNDVKILLDIEPREAEVFHIWEQQDFSYTFIRDIVSERLRFDLWLAVKS